MSMFIPIPVTATQVGTYFVGQYYKILQLQPEFVHQYYSNSSTMLRIDGVKRESAATMLQIHALIMSLNFTGIEIHTAHALESWNGGVLLMVSGSVRIKELINKRKFMETFFLAPQEEGYFVLNDVFHFMDEEHVQYQPSAPVAHPNLDSKVISTSTQESGVEPQAEALVAPIIDNGSLMNFNFQDQTHKVSENPIEAAVEQLNGSLQITDNVEQDHLPAVEEPVEQPQKHTYASILRIARGNPASPGASHPSGSKTASAATDWNSHSSSAPQQSAVTSNLCDRSGSAATEESYTAEDDVEIRSVYVRNLLPTVSEAEITAEFQNFGKIAQNGVFIRSRKDVGICYAFVEYEDMASVQNALKAGTAHVGGRQVYIEERRANSNIPYRATRGRGRGRGSYQTDAPRGRFGFRSSGRGGEGEYEQSRSRSDAYYRPSSRQNGRSNGFEHFDHV